MARKPSEVNVRRAMFLLPLGLVLLLSDGANAHEWDRYVNSAYGIRLSYPSSVFAFDRASERGDGEVFVSDDGRARLLIGAFRNSDHHSPKSYQRFISEYSYPGAEIDYAPVGRNWTVLSGERANTMFYEKVFFRCDGAVIGSFAMLYPVSERRFYDPIVERIEDSFRVGSTACR